MLTRDPKRRRTHPGAVLREDVLPSLGITKTEFAKRLNVSRQTMMDLLAERQGISPQMAVRLGHVLGNRAEFWLDLQQRYDLAKAKDEIDTATLTKIAV